MDAVTVLCHGLYGWLVWFMVFNATFNNISAISCRSVLLVEETGENNQTLSHNVVSSTGADPGFQVRGAHLKNCAEWREARKCVGYFV
jgi:hypothetical protein